MQRHEAAAIAQNARKAVDYADLLAEVLREIKAAAQRGHSRVRCYKINSFTPTTKELAVIEHLKNDGYSLEPIPGNGGRYGYTIKWE